MIDVYGAGGDLGVYALDYCKKKNIDLDSFIKEIGCSDLARKMFISGMIDGIGTHRTDKHKH